jgi:hypothetical protein
VFAALGYEQDKWELLQRDLLAMARTNPALSVPQGRFGTKFTVSGILKGPFGRSGRFVSVWLIPQATMSQGW